MLEVLRDDRSHRLIARIEAHGRRVVRTLELCVERRGEALARHDECAQALASHVRGLFRHVRGLFLEPVIALHDARHDNVRALCRNVISPLLVSRTTMPMRLLSDGERENFEDVKREV